MKNLIIEHKSTSSDIGLGSVYWTKLTLDQQISNYHPGARSLGFEPDGVLYDVLRKPALEPYKATPIEKRAYTQPKDKACPECKKKNAAPGPHVDDEGRGCADGRIVTDPGGKLYANMRERDETPQEYFERCAEEIASRPDHYFQRGVVVRLADEEREAAADLWATADAIRLAQNADQWPRNVDSCEQFHRLCDFWSVCSRQTTIDSPSFEDVPAHSEVDSHKHLPLITTSSVRTFRSCARRYYFEYVLQRRPRVDDERAFGTRVHKALEAWLPTRDLAAAIAAVAVPVLDFETAKLIAMLTGYHARWADEPLEVVAVEKEFCTDLVNPATGAKSRTFQLAGKLDGLVRKAA